MKQVTGGQTYKTSAGFTAVEVVITVLVVAALGVGGWYVWHKNQKSDSKQATSSQSSENTQATDPSEGGKYLVIKEWGVRAPLSDGLRGDIEYGIRKTVNLAGPEDSGPVYGEVVYFASKKLAAISVNPNTCGLKAGAQDDRTDQSDPNSYDGGPGIALERHSVQPNPTHSTDIQVNGSWYRAVHGNGGVCYEGSDGSQESLFIQSTVESLKSLQAVPKQ